MREKQSLFRGALAQKKSFGTLLRFTFLLAALAWQAAGVSVMSGPGEDRSGPAVSTRAASGATIRFWTQNGRRIDGVRPQALDLPHLVLYRDGALTEPAERTLIVEVTGVEVPRGGVTITLQMETQHGDPDLGGDLGAGARIPVWREAQSITNTLGVPRTGVTVVFVHEFGATVDADAGTVPTPTDYYRYSIAVTRPDHPSTNPSRVFEADYALLMESQWRAQLSDVQGTSAGAAPDELIIYYCDMFPFQKGRSDHNARLARKDVPAYVHHLLAPRMTRAFRLQTDDWGFPWSGAWTSFRPGEEAGRLSVALTDGQTWFHGSAPPRAHASISINVARAENGRYDTLTDGILSAFHHELFHNLQHDISLNLGGDEQMDGADAMWQFFSEGTADLASSVADPRVEFSRTSQQRAYMSSANGYLGGGELAKASLNISYEKMDPYYSALYWRFLYERCGEMGVIRRALTALYSGDIVDFASSTDLVTSFPEIIDAALQGSSCPFKTHAESLVAFARAVYALRLDGGRCREPGSPAGCGLYDPRGIYVDPPLEAELHYTGGTLVRGGAIPSSYGMDFIEVRLDLAPQDRPLTVKVQGQGASARFNVQIWRLHSTSGKPRALAPMPEVVPHGPSEDGAHIYVIPSVGTAKYDRLALIITRLDADEDVDPAGIYYITLESEAG